MSDSIILKSTGRELHCNCGYIGINEELELSEGYDGTIGIAEPGEEPMEYFNIDLTVPEQIELGTIMLDRWTKFIERARKSEGNP